MAISRLRFERVQIRAIRNVSSCDFRPAPRLNVIAGDNGHGKTSLLEALYLVATTRSFRSDRIPETIQQGVEVASVVANVTEADAEPEAHPEAREQRIGLAAGKRSMIIDGNRLKRAGDFAVRTPVIAFHPGDLDLASGPASTRRKLLDRLIVYLHPAAADDRQRYLKAVRERQRALTDHGPKARELDAYESLIAKYGARFASARQRVADRLAAALTPAFSGMAPAGLSFGAVYEPGGCEDEAEFLREISSRRQSDYRRGRATFGPQRDEIELTLDGRSVRHHASQGQQRIVTLALKAAELDCVREARRVHPILLLDDISSELDADRTDAALAFLTDTASQVFLTTTRPELFQATLERDPDARCWNIQNGALLTV